MSLVRSSLSSNVRVTFSVFISSIIVCCCHIINPFCVQTVRSFRLLFLFVSSSSLPSIFHSSIIDSSTSAPQFRNQSHFPSLCVVCAVSNKSIHLLFHLSSIVLSSGSSSGVGCSGYRWFGLAALMAVLHFPFLIAMFTFVYRANTPFSMILHFRPLTSYSSSLLAFNEYLQFFRSSICYVRV